jgi:DNA-binding SARP family transcriptional activator
VRIQALGGLEIRRDGLSLASTGKAKQRVLDLLRAIIAQGPQGADADELAMLLWPEAEGDAGRHALRVTVHRLRRLLGFEQAIIVADGRILLDPGWCQVDAFAFERITDSGASGPAHAARLLELYRGHFLASSDRPWLLPARERLRSKFLRSLEACALASLAEGRYDEAADLFRRGIELDAVAESLYRGLMRCRARQGRIAEGVESYRRCRDMLSIVLGVKPAAQTEALRAELLALQSRTGE